MHEEEKRVRLISEKEGIVDLGRVKKAAEMLRSETV